MRSYRIDASWIFAKGKQRERFKIELLWNRREVGYLRGPAFSSFSRRGDEAFLVRIIIAGMDDGDEQGERRADGNHFAE